MHGKQTRGILNKRKNIDCTDHQYMSFSKGTKSERGYVKKCRPRLNCQHAATHDENSTSPQSNCGEVSNRRSI